MDKRKVVDNLSRLFGTSVCLEERIESYTSIEKVRIWISDRPIFSCNWSKEYSSIEEVLEILAKVVARYITNSGEEKDHECSSDEISNLST